MANIEHRSKPSEQEGYHAILKPFPRALPELNAVSRIQITRALPPTRFRKKAPTLALVFPRRGGQRFRVDGKWYAPRGGELLLIPVGSQIRTGSEPITRIEGFDLYLQMDCKRPFLGHRQHEPIRAQLLRLGPTLIKAPSGANEALRKIYQWAGQAREELTVSRITLLMGVLLLDVLDVINAGRRPGGDSYVDEAEQYMLGNLAEPLNLTSLVEHTGYSRSALVEAFRRERGVPPMEWFLRLRIRHACEQLAGDDTPISTISSQLGFSSSQYFATVFKRFMSQSPTAYRENTGS